LFRLQDLSLLQTGLSDLIQLGAAPSQAAFARPSKASTTALWLQGVTLAWMLVELGVSAYAAVTARSPGKMAFGSDSFVELLSAVVVLLQWIPKMPISERRAHRAAAVLVVVLAFVVGLIALGSLVLRQQPETSRAGIGITFAALIAMPVLATLKRREARRPPECSPRRRCGPVRNVRLHRAPHPGWPCAQRGIPYPTV
jgi:hypothetical protein